MSHYTDTEQLLALADVASIRAHKAAQAEPDDWTAPIPGLIGALVHVLAAQVHATLAVADATAARQE